MESEKELAAYCGCVLRVFGSFMFSLSEIGSLARYLRVGLQQSRVKEKNKKWKHTLCRIGHVPQHSESVRIQNACSDLHDRYIVGVPEDIVD